MRKILPVASDAYVGENAYFFA